MALGVGYLLQQLDSQLEQLLNSWSIYTTLLSVVLVLYFLYPFFFTVEPDTHPFLLARQTTVSRVRLAGESAVYRALETPHGYPLRTGLNVKDPGAPKWSGGRDGDLRDIWRQATLGPRADDGKSTGQVGKLFTLLGKEEVVESTFEKLSAEIIAVGKDLKKHGSSRVAIYLSNSPELVVALFATLFYGLTPILISQEQSLERLATILKKTEADALVVGAGSVPLKELAKQYNGLKEVLWVVPKSSRHVDWNEVAEGEGGKAEIAVWHEIVDEEGAFASSELPSNDAAPVVSNIVVVSPPTEKLHNYEIVEYTQQNLVAATAAQISALPFNHRINSKDLLLPLLPLTNVYALTITLAALFSNASLALTAVTGKSATYKSAFNFYPRVAPTIILMDPQPLYTYASQRLSLQQKAAPPVQLWTEYRHKSLITSMTSTGRFPSTSSSSIPKAEQSVRLIYTQNVSYPATLNDLRIFTTARIIVGLTHPFVTGAISQTHMLDYRATKNSESHFGPPLSCVEVKLRETPGYTLGEEVDGDEEQHTTPSSPQSSSSSLPIGGNLIVSGPAVVGPPGTEVVVESLILRFTETGTIGVASATPQQLAALRNRQDATEKAVAEAMVATMQQLDEKNAAGAAGAE